MTTKKLIIILIILVIIICCIAGCLVLAYRAWPLLRFAWITTASDRISLDRPAHTPLPTRMHDPVINGPLVWDLEIVQCGQVIDAQDGIVKLERAPFTIRLYLPQLYLRVGFNISEQNDNHRIINPGVHLSEVCENPDNNWAPRAFCSGQSYAEAIDPDKELIISSAGTHHVDGVNRRWHNVIETTQGVIVERQVNFLKQKILQEEEHLEFPIEQYQGSKLYLSFLINYHDQDLIGEDELKEITLQFPPHLYFPLIQNSIR